MKKNAYFEMFTVEDSHWWYVNLHNLVISMSKKFLPDHPLVIFDAGCGTGGLLSKLENAGHNVEGLDFSEDALQFCRQRGLDQVFHADINHWLFEPNKYDLITSMDVLCHKWVHDEIKVLRSMATGVKENGLIMLNYPAFPVLSRAHDNVVMIKKRYTKKMLVDILSQANLTPLTISYRLPHAFIILFLLHIFDSGKTSNSDAQSDIAKIPKRFVNQFLIRGGKFENWLITLGIPMPLGSSLFVVAKKASQ